MPRLNSAGSAVCGVAGGTISVNGTTPAPLSGYIGGYWDWLSTSVILGPAQQTATDPFQVWQMTLPAGTPSVTTATAGNFFAAGAGKWALWTAGVGVITNVSGITSLPGAGLLDVSPSGQVAVVDVYASQHGISVYNSSGTRTLHLDTVDLTLPYAHLKDNILSYCTASGWHLVNVVTGATPAWYPRTDPISIIVPVQVGSTLMVIEAGNSLVARPANSPQGFVLSTVANFNNPDGVAMSANVLRVATSATLGEAPGDLLECDLTIASGANQRGTVVGGAVVFTTGTPLTRTTFPVGPQEGSNLTNSGYVPVKHAMTDAASKVTVPWETFFRGLNQNQQTVSGAVQAIPVAPPALPGFGHIAAGSEPTIAAFAPNDTLALSSSDGSVAFVANPVTKTLDLSASASSLLTVLTADPASPANDTGWLVRSGTSPGDSLALKARIAGTTYTLAEITL